MFYHNEAKILLYSERFHFFRRINLKGIRHLIFYQPPTIPHFYAEMCNLMQVRLSLVLLGNLTFSLFTVVNIFLICRRPIKTDSSLMIISWPYRYSTVNTTYINCRALWKLQEPQRLYLRTKTYTCLVQVKLLLIIFETYYKPPSKIFFMKYKKIENIYLKRFTSDIFFPKKWYFFNYRMLWRVLRKNKSTESLNDVISVSTKVILIPIEAVLELDNKTFYVRSSEHSTVSTRCRCFEHGSLDLYFVQSWISSFMCSHTVDVSHRCGNCDSQLSPIIKRIKSDHLMCPTKVVFDTAQRFNNSKCNLGRGFVPHGPRGQTWPQSTCFYLRSNLYRTLQYYYFSFIDSLSKPAHTKWENPVHLVLRSKTVNKPCSTCTETKDD